MKKNKRMQRWNCIVSVMLCASLLWGGMIPAQGGIRLKDAPGDSPWMTATPGDAEEWDDEMSDDGIVDEEQELPGAPSGQEIGTLELATPSDLLLSEQPETLDRILLEETFENGDQWEVNNPSAVTFTGGEARIKGGGANNQMGYKTGTIAADDFLTELQLTPKEGNENCNAKIGFKASSYEGERLQLRFDFPHDKVYLEKTDGNGSGNDTQVWSESADFAEQEGQTYDIAILTEDDTVTVWIDKTPVLFVTKDDIATMEQGTLVVAGQYPQQDFTVDDLVVSTNEQPEGDEYTVTLRTCTNGKMDDDPSMAGGTLTADKKKGYSGDTITLKPEAKYGYEFVEYKSFKEDGSSTDGLLPIVNNKFQLNEKFGNVTVAACFRTREPGKFELFYDDFSQDSINLNGDYSAVGDETRMKLEDGSLVIDGSSNHANYLLLDDGHFDGKKETEGYRISVDMERMSTANGTVQLMFKGSDSDISSRYAVVMNTQGSVMIRNFLSDGTSEELKKAAFTWPSGVAQSVLEVQGSQVSFSVNGKNVISYTSENDWEGMADATGLINMTENAPVAFDDLLLQRVPAMKKVSVVSRQEINGVLTEDLEGVSGTAASNKINVTEGERVELTAQPKAGWQLKEYQVENGTIQVENGSFEVPADAPETIRIAAIFEPAQQRKPETFYLDSENGNDANDGMSPQTAWKTLEHLHDFGTLVPGDQVLLKRGSVFEGEVLQFQGMGAVGAPICIDAYGEGEALPRLHGNGKVENVVSLYNQEYIEIRNLEITNTDPAFCSDFKLNGNNNTSRPLRAINVSIKDFGTASHIIIDSCYIHDINGNNNLKWNGGIFFDVKADVEGDEIIGVPSKYDHVEITNCIFERVDRSGIKLVSSGWCNQWEKNSPGVPVNWYPSTNVIIRGNYMEKIGGDGITNRDTDGALIEHNLVRDCRYQNTGYNVGIWPFEAANTVIQYNEAYNTHGTTDGQGLDCDHASSYSVMQYNYSHNNEGGFMLIMGGYPHTAPTIRYNISQNDRDKTFEFAQGIPNGTMIYNNTIYSERKLDRGVFFLSNTGAGVGINDFYVFNNLFSYPEGQVLFGGQTEDLQKKGRFLHNGYAGGFVGQEGEEGAVQVKDAGLLAPGIAPSEHEEKTPITAESGLLDGYRLTSQSPMIDAGIALDEAIRLFGGDPEQITDGRRESPRELYERAKEEKKPSFTYAVAENFPETNGVSYDTDFFGNNRLSGDKPDIGAAEYQKESTDPKPPITPELPDRGDDDDGGHTAYGSAGQESVRPNTEGWWNRAENGWQFIRPDGSLYRDTWVFQNGKWYWLDPTGMMRTGWQTIHGIRYYLRPETGEMAVGWVQIMDQWMFMDENGQTVVETLLPGGFWVDETGVWIP